MKAIRGAVTVENDTAEEIKDSVKELLLKIKQDNSLNPDDIICIMFSSTADLHSFYPAKAAREAGFYSCALYSSLEPDIDGSLSKCIRVMLLVDIDNTPRHVYLKEAVNLRKDISRKLNIAVDGPASSGKSTVSKIIAEKFDILYLDTGAMYRACALACVKSCIDCHNEEAVKNLLRRTSIGVRYENGMQLTMLNGMDVTEEIRTPVISMMASAVSVHEFVRLKMVHLQRKIASCNSCVLDGRDIGTNVLPNADFKFFLTASPEVRAERRTKENEVKGIKQPYDEVLKDILKRDEQDKTRKFAPLVRAKDAVLVDTSKLTVDEVVEFMVRNIQGKI